MQAPRQTKALHLDGTTLEGGGQLLRLALGLSALTKRPFAIDNIRGNRGSLGSDAGIKHAHLAAGQWLQNAVHATTEGLELRSRSLSFTPLPNHQPGPQPDPQSGPQSNPQSDLQREDSGVQVPDALWHDVLDEKGRLCRRESSIRLSSPGSVLLVLQAILPYVLFCSQPKHAAEPKTSSIPQEGEFSSKKPAVPLRLLMEGGTNCWHAPSLEYAEQVLFPTLKRKLGIGPIRTQLTSRGWSSGRPSIGQVQFDIQPMALGSQLPAFSLTQRGFVTGYALTILAPNARMLDEIEQESIAQLLAVDTTNNNDINDSDIWNAKSISNGDDNNVTIETRLKELSGHDQRLYLLIVAETSAGYLLGRDWLFDQRIDGRNPGKTTTTLVGRVVGDLQRELGHGGCVDEYLHDQLVVFQALARGRSQIHAGQASLHTQTAQWVAAQFMDLDFAGDGVCEGVGYTVNASRPDEHAWQYRTYSR